MKKEVKAKGKSCSTGFDRIVRMPGFSFRASRYIRFQVKREGLRESIVRPIGRSKGRVPSFMLSLRGVFLPSS